MGALYRRFDLLVTCGTAGAAPANRLEAVDYRNKWSRPNPFTPFNLLAGPALVVCNGFDRDGLPLALQFAGRPFEEAMVLRAGHAFEVATPWRQHRPTFRHDAALAPAPVLAKAPSGRADCGVESRVAALVGRAGLDLPDWLSALLNEVAPLAFAMADRIPRHSDWYAEPSATFSVPDWDRKG
jgi:aspartyl-tRNA(Asn)/glutamyl-tRNA(Gln) amidotransferase subunit A